MSPPCQWWPSKCYPLIVPIKWDHLDADYRSTIILLTKKSIFFLVLIIIFPLCDQLLFLQLFPFPIDILFQLTKVPLKGDGFLSIQICCKRWSGWLYHCTAILTGMVFLLVICTVNIVVCFLACIELHFEFTLKQKLDGMRADLPHQNVLLFVSLRGHSGTYKGYGIFSKTLPASTATSISLNCNTSLTC